MRNVWNVFLLVALLTASPALADAPALIPVQGVLSASDGTPVNDVFAVTFTLYTDQGGTTSVWSEEISVNFVNGHFTAYLGASTALDLGDFRDNTAAYLGIKVGGDDEMTPFELGSSPFAGFAQFAGTANDLAAPAKIDVVGDVVTQLNNDGSVHSRYTDAEAVTAIETANVGMPPGAVMPFATAACPAGWLPADGTSLDAATYPALAAAMGESGANFSVPDLRGEFVRGVDSGRGVDTGRSLRSAQAQDFKSFSVSNAEGGTTNYTHGPVAIEKSGRSSARLFGGYWSAPSGIIRFTWDDSEIRPRNVALLYCIKT